MDSRAAEIHEEERDQISSVGIDAIGPPNLSSTYSQILASMLSVLSSAVAQGYIKLRTPDEVSEFVRFVEQQILYRTSLVFDYSYSVEGAHLLLVMRVPTNHDAFGYTTQ